MSEIDIFTEKDGIIYGLLQEKDLEETISCLCEVFPRNEPMTKAAGINSDEFYYFAKIYCEKAVKDELSVIARDKASNKLIGFLISEDLLSEPPEGIEAINVKFYPVLALLDSLDEKYKNSCKVQKGQILHLFMGGVIEDFKNRNITTRLIEENLKLAERKNFSGAIGEGTGASSLHITCDKLGFNELFAIEYGKFTYKGEHVFKNVENSFQCVLVEKRFSTH